MQSAERWEQSALVGKAFREWTVLLRRYSIFYWKWRIVMHSGKYGEWRLREGESRIFGGGDPSGVREQSLSD